MKSFFSFYAAKIYFLTQLYAILPYIYLQNTHEKQTYKAKDDATISLFYTKRS
jgi:hypothetical protein